MLISKEMNAAMNEEIGRELEASHLYISMAAYVDGIALKLLAKRLFKQADEEREHALKFVRYIVDAGGTVEIPAVAAPQATFQSVEDVIRLALDWELEITNRINDLMKLAVRQEDFIAQDFLRWFVSEQLEEVSSMTDLLKVVQQAGERNLIMTEAYLAHME